MTASWSQIEETFVYDCIFGCHGTDFESTWEADQAEASHDCMHARFPGGAGTLNDNYGTDRP